MNRRFRPLFLVATLCAALIAGCGGSSSSTTTTSTTSSAKTSKTSASTTSSVSKTSSHTTAAKTTPVITGNVGAVSSGAIAAECQTALAAATTLNSAEKSQFKSYCTSLGHDNPTQLKAAEKTLCKEIIKSVPTAYRSIAQAECSKL
jgi:hypothetical protein